MRIERETFWAKKFGNNYITNNLIIFQKKEENVNTIRLKIILGTKTPISLIHIGL